MCTPADRQRVLEYTKMTIGVVRSAFCCFLGFHICYFVPIDPNMTWGPSNAQSHSRISGLQVAGHSLNLFEDVVSRRFEADLVTFDGSVTVDSQRDVDSPAAAWRTNP